MEETKNEIIEKKPVSDEEFQEKIHSVAEANREKLVKDFGDGIIHLKDYNGIRKFSSIRRAIRRGHVSLFGDIYPRRPFNNRKRNKKGDVTYERRKIYGQLVHRSGETY